MGPTEEQVARPTLLPPLPRRRSWIHALIVGLVIVEVIEVTALLVGSASWLWVAPR